MRLPKQTRPVTWITALFMATTPAIIVFVGRPRSETTDTVIGLNVEGMTTR